MHWRARIVHSSGLALVAAILSISFCGVHPAFAEEPPAAHSARLKTITVAAADSFPPWTIRDASGETTGILKDLWSLWSARTGIEVSFRPMSLQAAQEAVLSGEVDVIDALTATDERRDRFDFSEPHLETQVMLYFNETISGVVDAKTASGFVIGVVEGDACGTYLTAAGNDQLKKYPNHEAMVTAAANDQISLFCAQQPVAGYFLNRLGKADHFRHSPPLYSPHGHWAVRKGNSALFNVVSQGFDTISTAEHDEILEKWYGAKVEHDELPLFLRYAGYILLGMVGLTGLLVGWNRILQRQVAAKTASLLDMLANLQAAEKSLDEKNSALRQMLRQTIDALATATARRDLSTAGHEHRVSELAVEIGRQLGFDEERLEGLSLAAIIHDIGQIQVPAEILTRPRRLTPEEFELVKMHAEAGYDILKDIRFPWPIAEIVYQHHENLDGSGYPRGLKGDQILPEARIIHVADSIDAILSHRPFRRAATLDVAIAEIQSGKGAQYDPVVVDICVKLLQEKGCWFLTHKHSSTTG